MANPRVRRRGSLHSSLDSEEVYESRGEGAVAQEVDAEQVRRSRLQRLEGETTSPPAGRRSAAAIAAERSNMPETSTVSASLRSSHKSRRGHRHSESSKHRRRRASTLDDAAPVYVYGPPADLPQSSRIRVQETRRLGRDGESSEDDHVRSRSERDRPKEKKIRVVYVTKEELKSSTPKERRPRTERKLSDRSRTPEETVHRSRAQHVRRKTMPDIITSSPPKRSTPSRQLPSESRASLRRSNTTSSHIPSSRAHEALVANTHQRRSSLFGNFFAPAIQTPREPEKLVECLTCLSDDIPKSKSAKLACGHRMCNSCLKRIFRLSTTDPQHMPPKCCTADHIPLKHVEKLFDNNFKRLWNKKFAEFSTKNRIYCPARRCGEWIKPSNIHKEGGVKYGKCGRCKTKVCCQCNGKWHGSKDCPKDEETNRLLETAKNEGWQRCYSCRTLVELKEGCNHMTCRCTAEFCMICGLKWKTCNCPWFNYEAVEADRLNHMQVPLEPERPERVARVEDEILGDVARPRRLRRRPNTYHEEMHERRRQERDDEDLARRLQRANLNRDLDDDDYQGGVGDIHGIGNGAGHFMNQDYIRAAHNILTGNFDQATAAANYVMGVNNARGVPPPPPLNLRPRRPSMVDRYPMPAPPPRAGSPPPLLRRHTLREQVYNEAQTRPSERVVPRRTRTDYASEAAVHAPERRLSTRREGLRRQPGLAALAGLAGRQKGNNRVSLWRTHVEAGAPEEGVLSI